MNRMLQRCLASTALLVVLVGPVSGCAGGPQRRPAFTTSNDSVAQSVAKVRGTGAVAAVVMGDTALVAIQLDEPKPGGTDGWPLTGNLQGGPAGRPGSGPNTQPVQSAHPGGSPALPGGTISPGGATAGGFPTSTQAVPSGRGGGLATSDSANAPSPAPSSLQSAPMDILNRAANQVLSEHPLIREVRFLTAPGDAVRLQEIARAIDRGDTAGRYRLELNALTQRAFPAGTSTQRVTHPPQGKGISPNRKSNRQRQNGRWLLIRYSYSC